MNTRGGSSPHSCSSSRKKGCPPGKEKFKFKIAKQKNYVGTRVCFTTLLLSMLSASLTFLGAPLPPLAVAALLLLLLLLPGGCGGAAFGAETALEPREKKKKRIRLIVLFAITPILLTRERKMSRLIFRNKKTSVSRFFIVLKSTTHPAFPLE